MMRAPLTRPTLLHVAGLMTLAAALATPGGAQTDSDDQTFRAGRFDGGKMWTFEYPPSEYFTTTYGFDATPEWFERARMAALRIPGCSASFVSPNGLLATNHHCVRGRVSAVSEEGEELLDNGFFARTLQEERPIPDFHADQLIAVEDVTAQVSAAIAGLDLPAEREAAREGAFDAIRSRLLGRHASDTDSVWVQMIDLYSGGRHSAYVFRRFTDVRLVMAVELNMGFFGGDPDNFTYPRYALDFAFLRVYRNGEPYRTDHHFEWGVDGVEIGDVVFVIGSPGPTTRGTTISQLEFLRDVEVPAQRQWLSSRHAALGQFQSAFPEAAEDLGVRNLMFSLSNSLKAANGRLDALHTPEVMEKRRDAERALRRAASENGSGAGTTEVFDRMADLQRGKRRLGGPYAAFYGLASPQFGSRVVERLVRASIYASAMSGGAPQTELDGLKEAVLGIEDRPEDLERRLLAARLADFRRYLGPDHEITRTALQDGSPEASAAALLALSAFASAESTVAAMDGPNPLGGDPGEALAGLLVPAYFEFQRSFQPLVTEEGELAGRLGELRFEVYGQSVPPDASSSPRITDGVVSRFEYNGTVAPAYTTFFGIYDRHHGHEGSIDWALPERWRTPPAGLDLSTPLNFVSTADTYGGNSGSPAVTRELALVGLNFDRNIPGLSRDYIYLPERGRNVMVDARAVQAALDHAYDMDRIVAELETGALFMTEVEADEARR